MVIGILPVAIFADGNVAEVGGTAYATLLDAVNAAANGDTIKLIDDYTIETAYATIYDLPEGATLDLNNKTLTIPNATAMFSGKNVTIKNGTIKLPSGATNRDYALYIGNAVDDDDNRIETNVAITDVTVQGGINVRYGAEATLKDVTSTSKGKYYAVYAASDAMVTILSGTYTGGTNGYDVYVSANATVNISDGTFNKKLSAAEGGSIAVSGGTFANKPNDSYLVAGATIADNADGSVTVIPPSYVAEVDGEKYITLLDAINAAEAGDTIKLIDDCTIEMDGETFEERTVTLPDGVTLDLNGNTLTVPFQKAPFAGNNITIKNGTLTTGTLDNYVLYINGGSFTVENVTTTNGINVQAGELTLNNVDVTNPNKYYAVYAGPNTEVNILGGTFKKVRTEKAILYADDGAIVNIYGGTFELTLFAVDTATIAVSGGTFENPVDPDHCAEGYLPHDNGDGTYGVIFGLISVPVDYFVYPNGPFVGDSFDVNVTISPLNSDDENAAIISEAVADAIEANMPANYHTTHILVRNGASGWFVRVYVAKTPEVISVPVDFFVYPDGPFVGEEFNVDVTIYPANSDDENAALIREAVADVIEANIPAPYSIKNILIRNGASGWFVRAYLNKADANIDIIVNDEIYDGAPVSEATVVITGEDGEAIDGYYTIQYHKVDVYGAAIGDAIYSRNTQWPTVIEGALPTDAGLYRVGVTFHGTDAYNGINWYSETFEIQKDSVVVEIADVSKTYDGTPVEEATVTVTGATSGMIVDTYYTILYQQNGETIYSRNTRYPDVIDGTLAALPVDAGTYTVVVVTEETDNYEKASWVVREITIAQKDISDAEIVLGDALTYTGEEQTQAITSVTVDGLDVTYTVSANKGTDAGTYILIVTGNGNFTGTAIKTWTIAKAKVEKPTADTTAFVYNKTEQTYTVAASELYTVSGNKRTNAGSQNVTVSLNDKDNYEWADGTTDDVIFTFTIAKATPVLTIVPSKDKLYGGGKVKMTVTGAPDEGTYSITSRPNIAPSLDGSYQLPNIQRTYTFTVTYAESENYNEASASCTVVVVRYYYIPKLYKLTFEENGGTLVKDVTKGYGEKVDLAKYETTRDGYEFTGWYLDSALTKEATSVKLIRNTVVYAGWEKIVTPVDPTPIVNPFNDVAVLDWFYDDVMYVYENGLMNGTEDDMFSPELSTTRGMIVTILWRLEGRPVAEYDGVLLDVPTTMYYAPAIDWAAANGILEGYGDGKFGPEDAITREQMATILWRYAKYKDVDVSSGSNTDITEYADDEKISDYAIPAMKWAIAEGIIGGKDGKRLDPAGEAARCEVAAILHRYCLLIEG